MGRDELDGLLNLCLDFANKMLTEHGEFYPFGAKVSSDGESGLVQGSTGEERPAEQALIALMLEGFRDEARRGTIRACALCVNVALTRPDGERVDAVRVTLEDANEALNLSLPYKIGFRGRVKYGELERNPAQPQVFRPNPY